MATMVQKGHGNNGGHGAKKVDKMAVMMQEEIGQNGANGAKRTKW